MTRNADNTKRRHQPAAIALPFTVPAWGILFAPPSGCQRPTHSSREAAAALSRGREPMEPACTTRKARQQKAPTTESAYNRKRLHQTAANIEPLTVPSWAICLVATSREAAAARSRGREPMEPACMTRNADNTKRRHQTAAIALPFTVPAWGILFAPPSGCQRPTHSSREAAAALSRGREPMEPACMMRNADNRKRRQQKAPTSNGG